MTIKHVAFVEQTVSHAQATHYVKHALPDSHQYHQQEEYALFLINVEPSLHLIPTAPYVLSQVRLQLSVPPAKPATTLITKVAVLFVHLHAQPALPTLLVLFVNLLLLLKMEPAYVTKV